MSKIYDPLPQPPFGKCSNFGCKKSAPWPFTSRLSVCAFDACRLVSTCVVGRTRCKISQVHCFDGCCAANPRHGPCNKIGLSSFFLLPPSPFGNERIRCKLDWNVHFIIGVYEFDSRFVLWGKGQSHCGNARLAISTIFFLENFCFTIRPFSVILETLRRLVSASYNLHCLTLHIFQTFCNLLKSEKAIFDKFFLLNPIVLFGFLHYIILISNFVFL